MAWFEEIRVLGSDFRISPKVVEGIIDKVSSKYSGKSNDYLYDRAWSLLFPYM